MTKVELGIQTGQQDIDLDDLRKLWRYCDANGFDWISIWDHFYESPPRDGTGRAYESVALMAALALETQHVRVGCLVFCMSFRNPALLAKSMTTIDHLSHGRVTVGLGAGWHVPEHEGYGYELPPVKERMDRLSEGMRVMRLMLTQERSNFEGKHFQLKDAANYPPPVQSRVPIIIGGGGEQRTMSIAARRADGWNIAYPSLETYKHKVEVLDDWCEKHGRDPRTLERSINLHFIMSGKGETQPRYPAGAVYGPPQQVIDQIGGYVDIGVQRVNIALRPPIDWEAMQSYVEDVMPAFRA